MKPNIVQMIIGVWLSLQALLSCSGVELPPEKYSQWVASHREMLTASQQQNFTRTTLTYLPADWLAINEVGPDRMEHLVAARKEYAGLEYYRLRIALQSEQGDVLQFGAGSTDVYYQRVEYFSFGLQNDLRLLVGPDTLPCRLFHFERNYGAAPYADFMLGFESNVGNNLNRTLIYHDRVFTDSLILLTIPVENIDQIPTLKL